MHWHACKIENLLFTLLNYLLTLFYIWNKTNFTYGTKRTLYLVRVVEEQHTSNSVSEIAVHTYMLLFLQVMGNALLTPVYSVLTATVLLGTAAAVAMTCTTVRKQTAVLVALLLPIG